MSDTKYHKKCPECNLLLSYDDMHVGRKKDRYIIYCPACDIYIEHIKGVKNDR